jgi:hypothetical protein
MKSAERTIEMKTDSKRRAGGRLGAAPCSAMPSAQALIFQPELTHSVWTDVMHRKRSRKSLEAMLRKEVRAGRYVGYRLLTIEEEYIGVCWWPNH